jgi:hypothetical protein
LSYPPTASLPAKRPASHLALSPSVSPAKKRSSN